MKIFLIGMPGAGKTYWGEKLKKKLKISAYDLDALVQMMEEKSIAEIFEEEGEEGFRKAETKMLRLFKEKKKFIVSCGGGTPCFDDNMKWMNKNGITIWLDEPVELLMERLMQNRDERPLLKNLSEQELQDYIEKTLEERSEFYSQATHRVTAKELAGNGILDLIEEYA